MMGRGKERWNIPASNSNFLVKAFIPNLTKLSVGLKTSLKSKKPIKMGLSTSNPKALNKLLFLINTLNSAKM